MVFMATSSQSFNPFLSPEDTESGLALKSDVIRPATRPGVSGSAKTIPIGNVSVASSAPPKPLNPTQASAPRSPVATSRPLSSSIAPQVLEPERKSKQYIRWGVYIFLVLLVGTASWYAWQRLRPTNEVTLPIEVVSLPETTPIADTVPTETITSNAEYSSENFRAGEIVFGGELAFLQSEDSIVPLEISAIRGEAFTEKGKQEVKLVVTWQTNRLSLADVEYAKGVGQNKKVVTEDDYSFNHSVIISGLESASTYLYTIKASDRFGNTVVSDPYAVFTGAKNVSLFDLIAGAIGDVFGWAIDK